jgi:hypothetical protein
VAKFLITMLVEPPTKGYKNFMEAQDVHVAALMRAGFKKIRFRASGYTDLDPNRNVSVGGQIEKFHWAAHGEDQNLTYLKLIAPVTKAKAIRKLVKKTK